jgi:hypothetical protein
VDRRLILENPRGLSAKSAKSRPWVDFPKILCPLCKISEISRNNELFPNGKFVDWVHVSVDWPGALGSPWTDAGADNGHGGALTGARPPAAPVRQSSPAGAQNGEGGTGSSSRASPGLERHRGGREMMGKARWCRRSVRGRLELGEREMRAGKGVVKLGEVARLL